MENNEVEKRIAVLEAENAWLKSLLAQKGFAYTMPDFTKENPDQEVYDPNQGERIVPVEITHTLARRFFRISGDAWMSSGNVTRTRILARQDISHSVIIFGKEEYAPRHRETRLSVGIVVNEPGLS